MALVRKSANRKKLITLLLVFLALFGAGMAYLLFFQPSSGVDVTVDSATRQLQATYSEAHAIDQKLLPDTERAVADRRYKELRQFLDVPVTSGKIGRPNPFSRF